MKREIFNKMLNAAVEKWHLDPAKTNILVRWWMDDDLHAVFSEDCNNKESCVYLISTEEKVNYSERHGPATFYIWKDAMLEHQAVHKTATLDRFIDSRWIADFDQVKILISRSPVNSIIDINPFATYVTKGFDDSDCLVLQIEGRDSGEYVPDDRFTGPESLRDCAGYDFDPADRKTTQFAVDSAANCSGCRCDEVSKPEQRSEKTTS